MKMSTLVRKWHEVFASLGTDFSVIHKIINGDELNRAFSFQIGVVSADNEFELITVSNFARTFLPLRLKDTAINNIMYAVKTLL